MRCAPSPAAESASTRWRRTSGSCPCFAASPRRSRFRRTWRAATTSSFAPTRSSIPASPHCWRRSRSLPEWARHHTRLLERAEEWQDRGRDPSFLLRGSDLTDGERWLGEQGADREPQPTPLQTEYLLVSRAAATRRQRITIGAVAAALAVSVVLAVVALVQRNEATQQRDEAVRQAQLARSRELAAAAIAAVEADPWKALEIAVDAAETSPTPESTDALRAALEAPRESALLQVPDEFIGNARFTGDSADVVTASYDRNGRRRILRWDLASGEPAPYGARGRGSRPWGT